VWLTEGHASHARLLNKIIKGGVEERHHVCFVVGFEGGQGGTGETQAL
jgi:hypothetical protein